MRFAHVAVAVITFGELPHQCRMPSDELLQHRKPIPWLGMRLRQHRMENLAKTVDGPIAPPASRINGGKLNQYIDRIPKIIAAPGHRFQSPHQSTVPAFV